MPDKIKKEKIEKLNNHMNQARENLTQTREELADSMKQTYEELETWKQAELAKGKNPEKVQKKYERGMKIVERVYAREDRRLDRLDTKVDDWEFKGRLHLEKAAHKKVVRKVLTSSLSKMEKILKEDPNTELKYPIAGYCAIKKKEAVSEAKYPNIYREIKNWENAIKKASAKDEYFKTFLSLVSEGNAKERRLMFKTNAAAMVNEIIEKENISIRFLSEYTKIKYSNLYNFLKKEIYSDLSFKRSHDLLISTLNLKDGFSREEVFIQYKQKLIENWDYQDVIDIKEELE